MKYFYLLIFLFLQIFAFSQESLFKGLPLIRNYNSKEYGAEGQNWDIAQKSNGITYFGNNIGVLEFDGVNWDLIKLSNKSVVRSVQNHNDTIYVAGNSEFGYLTSDSIGKTIYVSISSQLPKNKKNFGDVWYIKFAKNKVYFIGKKDIFIYDKGKLSTSSYNFEIFSAFTINDRLLITDLSSIYSINSNELTKLYSFEQKLPKNTSFFKLNNDEFIILNNNSSSFNLKKMLEKKSDFLRPINLKNIKLNGIFNCKINTTGDLMFSTINGALIYNKDFEYLYTLNFDTGLPTNTVLNAIFDNYGNIWVAHGSGISYVEFNSPFTILSKGQNVSNSNLFIAEYKDKLYLSSINKISILEQGDIKFKVFEDASYNNFAGTIIKTDKDSILIISSKNKIFYTNGGELKLLYEFKDNPEIIISLLWTPTLKDFVFVGGTDNLKYLDIKIENNIPLVDTVNYIDIQGMIVTMDADNEGNIWVAPYYGGIYKVVYSEGTQKFKTNYYDDKDGIKVNLNRVYFNHQLNQLFVLNEGIYTTKNKYNPDKTNYSFVHESGVFKDIAHSKVVQCFSSKEKIIFQGKNKIYSCIRTEKNTYSIDSTSYNRLLDFETTEPVSCISPNGIEWIPFGRELIRVDPKKMESSSYKPLPTIISKITINNSNFYGGRDTIKLNNITELEFFKNSITFEYALPFFVGFTKYKYKLEGYNKEWSSLSEETKAIYTNLDAGKYTFKVIGVNIYGKEGKEASYTFTILPPWYKTIWMYIVYAFLFIILIFLVVFIFTKNLKARNKKLEEIVKDRTKEIEDKNVLITDSIKYAKHIQNAVLPSQEIISEEFKNAFIYFKPRDIVSGDFYWYHKKNNSHYIAVADCTGHGVPGAFMSMIGNTLLNQIIRESDIEKPSEILGRLNIELKKAFVSSETQDDGMDITVCRINRNDNTFEISMANHIALIVCDNKVEEIEGDIFSIGGPFAKPEELQFANYKRDIKPNMSLYMFSDGYSDQFGGPEDKKLMISKLKELVLENVQKDIGEQKNIIKEYFVKWKGDSKQIDDVLIIGIKF